MNPDSPITTKEQETRRHRLLNVQFYLTILFFLTLALPNELNIVFLILLSLLTVYLNGIKIFVGHIKNDSLFQLLIIYFLFSTISYLRDHSVSSFFSSLERRFPIVLIPVLFSVLNLSSSRLSQLFKAYVISIVVAILASLIAVYLNVYWNSFNIKYFSWELAQNTIIPSNYLAMYCGFAIIVIVDDFRNNKLFSRAASYPLVLFLFAYLVLTGARMPFIATMIILLSRGFYNAYAKKQTIGLKPVVLIVLVSVLSIFFVPYLRHKFSSLFTTKEPRYYEFKAAVKLILLKPIVGYGPREAENALKREYEKMGFNEGAQQKFNAHNEFLQTAITMGVPGCILLLVILIACFKRMLETKQYLAFAFILMFTMMLMVEVLLIRNKGIIFFATFISLFLFHGKSVTDDKNLNA